MKSVYLDNAATTPLDPEVLDAMLPFMKEHFGNPSSVHAYGRKTRSAIEMARKQIAGFLNAKPAEIIFTSGGTEADNTALHTAVNGLGVRHIISSAIEHHAVLHTAENLCQQHQLERHLVRIDNKGHIDLNHLEELLAQHPSALVTLMHANNEIGNLLPIKQTGELCRKYNAYFHSDTVQTIGHFPIDTEKIHVHFMACGGHKFHGPKGIGFLYRRGNIKITPLLTGGAQERGWRAGTENLYSIVGLAKAMEIAHRNMKQDMEYIQGLKNYMILKLKENIHGVSFNGDFDGSSLYTILNVMFPELKDVNLFIFNLDLKGLAVSGGSACSSGSEKGSHVLAALGCDAHKPAVRFSFSKFTTRAEIDFALEKVSELYKARVII